MIRIVGLQKDEDVQREFLLLQNQCAMRINLRGHAIVSDCRLEGETSGVLHLFRDDAWIPPGGYVMVHTGHGHALNGRTKDGSSVYKTFMGRESTVWGGVQGNIHLLHPQHTYCLRRGEALLV